jgi:8-oxo-dGTP diphosphatase
MPDPQHPVSQPRPGTTPQAAEAHRLAAGEPDPGLDWNHTWEPGPGATGEPPGADAILLNRRGEVLLVLRDDKPDIPCPNTWALLGGYIEPGETPEQALLRELREEIGVRLPGARSFREYRWPECTEFIFWQWLDIDPFTTPLAEGQCLAYFAREQLAGLAFASHYGEVLADFFSSDACPVPAEHLPGK